MMKACELKVKHQVNSRASLKKKGKAREYWNRESLKNMPVCLPSYFQCLCNNFHTSGKNEKENMHNPRRNFLRRSHE